MLVSEFKQFITNDPIYAPFLIVETSIKESPEKYAQCIMTLYNKTRRYSADYTQEALSQLRNQLAHKLRREAIILIDSIQGRILTSFKPESGIRFYEIVKQISFKGDLLYIPMQIDERIPLIKLFEEIFPNPPPTQGERHEQFS